MYISLVYTIGQTFSKDLPPKIAVNIPLKNVLFIMHDWYIPEWCIAMEVFLRIIEEFKKRLHIFKDAVNQAANFK